MNVLQGFIVYCTATPEIPVTPQYKCLSSGSCTRDDALGTFTSSNCNNSCTSQTSLTCSSFSPNGLTDSGQTGPNGMKIFNTADYKGGRRLLNVTRSPATATIQPSFTNTPASAPALVFEPAADRSGNWIVNIPDNNSITTDNDYTLSAAVSSAVSSSATVSCTPFMIHVPKKPVDTACPVDVTSTQVRMRVNNTQAWTSGATINLGDTVSVGGFYNNQTDTPIGASNVILTSTGPDGSQSHIATLTDGSNNPVSYQPSLVGRYTITASTTGKTGANCRGSAVLTVNATPVIITSYRFAQNPTDLENPANQFKPLLQGQGGAIEQITLSDNTPGQNKSVFVQFKTSTGGITERAIGNIFFAGPDPVITGSACDVRSDLKDGSLIFTVTGNAFGRRDFANSKLVADTTNLDEIKEWTDQKVVARMANPPDTSTGKSFITTLTRADGVKVSASCSINTTQIFLGAKLICRSPSNFDQNNVQLTLVQNALGIGTTASGGDLTAPTISFKAGNKLTLVQNVLGIGSTASGGDFTAPTINFKAGNKARETVTLSKEGTISNLKTKLQEGLEYIVCIKAPKSLRLCSKPFTAVSGNNVINKFELPVGDVNDDEVINSVDASICKAEWGVGKNKNCEFNRDGVTNSFEWGCLLHDFNAGNQQEPQ